ncbi:MAG: hypothetical protein O7D35_06430 [Acidobacteria bacterium]|nr:hypothetical protein [Acidobacteriota bacterium]
MRYGVRQIGLAVVVIILASVSSPAADMEREIRARLLGAWVITGVETYSDCRGMYTNNRINGSLVKSGGAHRFQIGELAKVDKINVHRSRVDVLLSVPEPLLVPYEDGPFTLYNEVPCRIELEVELSRQTVKKKDSAEVERTLEAILERHNRLEQAEQSPSWNRRQMASYPDDYDTVLREHAVWQANRINESIQARIDEAVEETSRVVNRVSSDPDYLAGFAVGVEEARATELVDCRSLMAVRFLPAQRPSSGNDEQARARDRGRRGNRDGKNLVFGLEMAQRLPACFVPIPELPLQG